MIRVVSIKPNGLKQWVADFNHRATAERFIKAENKVYIPHLRLEIEECS